MTEEEIKIEQMRLLKMSDNQFILWAIHRQHDAIEAEKEAINREAERRYYQS